jgi:hypothetical protein
VKIHALIAAEPDSPDRPYLVDAWDDAMVQANPQGWRDACAEERGGAHATAAVVIDVPDEQLLPLLYPPPAGQVHGTAMPGQT